MLFRIDAGLAKQKFLQMADGITKAIRDGHYKQGDPLPSVLDMCAQTGMARMTVIKAYSILKRRGIVRAVPQKGYFVASEDVRRGMRVLLVFDELSAYKQDLYDAFRAESVGRIKADIVFHHCDIKMLESIIRDRVPYYDRIAIMPFADPRVGRLVKSIDRRKVVILDRSEMFNEGEYSFVGQGFGRELVDALESASDIIGRYKRVVLVIPGTDGGVAMKSSQAPSLIPAGVKKFCNKHRVKLSVMQDVKSDMLMEGDLWFVIDDNDLVEVVEAADKCGLKIGKELGVLAYNETDMRRVVAGGITVVSTDFKEMGRRLARMIGKSEQVWEVIPTKVKRRNSV